MLNEIPFKLSNRRSKKVKKGKTYLMNINFPYCGVDIYILILMLEGEIDIYFRRVPHVTVP